MADTSNPYEAAANRQINDLTEAIAQAEKDLSALAGVDQEAPEIFRKRREEQIKTITAGLTFRRDSTQFFHELAIQAEKVKDYGDEFLTAINQDKKERDKLKATYKALINSPSFIDEKTSLEELADNLILQQDTTSFLYRAEQFLRSKPEPLLVGEAHNLPIAGDAPLDQAKFWDWLATISRQEEAAASVICLKLESQIDALNLTNVARTFFPEQPNKQRIKDLEDQMAAMKKDKTKTESWLSYFHTWQNNLHGRFSTQEEVDRAAAQMARQLVTEDEKSAQEKTEAGKTAQEKRIVPTETGGKPPPSPPQAGGGTGAAEEIARRAAAGQEQPPQEALKTYRAIDYLMHPTILIGRLWGGLMNVLNKAFGKRVPGEAPSEPSAAKAAASAAQAGKKLVTKAVKKEAGEAGKNFLSGALIKLTGVVLPTVVGQILSIASLAKSALSGISKFLLPPELREKLADLSSGFNIWLKRALVFLAANSFILGMAGLGLVFFGPLGGIAGFFLGTGMNGILGPMLFSPGGLTPFAGTGLSISSVGGFTFVTPAAGGFLGLFTGFTAAAAALIAVPIGITLLAAFAIISAIVQANGESAPLGQNEKFAFLVEQTAAPVQIADYNADNGATITYNVTVTAQDQPVTISDIKAKITRIKNGEETTISEPDITKPTEPIGAQQNFNASYQILISGEAFQDSQLVGTVTVTGTNGAESDTQKSVSIVRIGNPPVVQPYGYPAAGQITSLDTEPSTNGIHCGTFLTNGGSRRCIPGGLDIGGPAGTPVHSTIDGTVEMAQFDNGNCSLGAANADGLCPLALLGVVYVRGDGGQYETSYLHLSSDLKVNAGDRVQRGTLLGYTYVPPSGSACWTINGKSVCVVTGPHVHYQILFNGINDFFNNPTNWGPCSDGKILPSLPIPALRVSIPAGVVTTEGFTCQ